MQLVIIEINFLHSHPLGPKLCTADIANYLNIDEEFAIRMIHKYKRTTVCKNDVAKIRKVDDKDDVLTQIVDKLLKKLNDFEEKFRMAEQRREIMQKTVDELTEKVNRFVNIRTEVDSMYREYQDMYKNVVEDRARINQAANLVGTVRNLSTKDALCTEADILKENTKLTAATIQQKFDTLTDRIEELEVLLDAPQHKCHDTWIPIPMVKTAAECKQEFTEKLKEKFGSGLGWVCDFDDNKATITEDQQRRIMDAICYEARFREKFISILTHSHTYFNYPVDISMKNIKLDMEEILNTKVRLYENPFRSQQIYNYPPPSFFTNRPAPFFFNNQPSPLFNNRLTSSQPSSVRVGYNAPHSLLFRPVPLQKFDNSSRPKHFIFDAGARNCGSLDRSFNMIK